jgi:amino acid adenylation domain-containing protein
MSKAIQGFRLSPYQKRIWRLLDDRHCNIPSYARCVILIEGRLDQDALRRALHGMIEAHQILHTSFSRPQGMKSPIQVVNDCSLPMFEIRDISQTTVQEQSVLVEEMLGREEADVVALESSPVRSTLTVFSKDKHMVLFTLSSICSDVQTLSNILYEISDGYEDCVLARPTSARAVQYVQYSEWQNELNDDVGTPGFSYWNEKASSPSPPLSLPFESTPAPGRDFRRRTHAVRIEGDQLERIDRVAGAHSVTPDIFLLASLEALVWRVSRQGDFTICKLFPGRKFEELKEGIGLFAKWIPLACRIESEASFDELLTSVDRAVQEAHSWEEFFTGDPDSPLFPLSDESLIGFEYVEWPATRRAAGVFFSLYKQDNSVDTFKLKIRSTRFQESLQTEFVFDPDVVPGDYISRLTSQFRVLIESACRNPRAKVSSLNLLTEEDRQRILKEFNETQAEYDAEMCLHSLFESQVDRGPDGCALAFNGEAVTYRQLNERANKLAHYLIEIGVGPDILVGVCLKRSINMVVSLLAILKAGGAYVPIDPSYPAQRITYVIEDARMEIIISQEDAASELIPDTRCHLICLECEWPRILDYSSESPRRHVQAGNLAYVIYTSGSTGRPKGVMIPHGGVVNYLRWSTKAYKMADGEGAPVHTPVGFDLTVTSLFGPLVAGKSCVLVSEEGGIDELREELIAAKEYSLVKLTPAHLEILSEMIGDANVTVGAKVFVIGGEALYGERLRYWRERAGGTRLMNEYGPTETVVGGCVYEVKREEELTGPVAIGKPISNVRMYILDDRMEPVGEGIEGEIYIAGKGVGRGYLNGAQETARRYVPEPWGDSAARMYRTGDRGRYKPDGNIEYLGRVDRQIKIRGFRVELEEVERAMEEMEWVHTSAVTVVARGGAEQVLAGYVTKKKGATGGATELKKHLKERLPYYMVPAMIVELEQMPVNINGKIDLKALPVPKEVRPELESKFVLPRTETERTITGIWQEVLHMEDIGIYDNFFDLGGHSILMLQIFGKLRGLFDVDLAMVKLFKYPTISSLADYINRSLANEPASQDPRSLVEFDKERVSLRRQGRRERRKSIGG